MKKIIKRFWGVAIIVVLLSSLFVAAPASAGAQAFSFAAEPNWTSGITAVGTQILDFAVATTNQNTIYAATTDNALKSVDQGRTWTKINNGPAGTSLTTTLVAIAPDDANVVVYAGADLHIRLSLNGGTSFFDLGVPSDNGTHTPVGTILDIDISTQFTDLYGFTYRYIGVAGAAGGAARLYYVAFGAYAPYSWYEVVQDWAPAPAYYAQNNDCFFAIKFSPAFNIDSVAYVLAQNTAATKRIELHVVSFNILTLGGGQINHGVSGYTWYNENVAHWVGEGTLINANAGGTAVRKGQIVFSPGYSGVYYSPYARIAYCSVSTAGLVDGGAFQLGENTSAVPVITPLVGGSIWSIALNAGGTSLQAAGAATATTVATSVPFAGIPGTPGLPIKQIGGGPGPAMPFGGVSSTTSNMTIFYAGTNVLCSKVGDAGAFSLSRNNGYTWNDISLVNDTAETVVDKAIKADGTQRYVVTQGQYWIGAAPGGPVHTSVYFWDGTYWERVFVRADNAGAHDYVIRASPVSFGVVYLGDKTDGTIYYTSTYGRDDWRWRLAPLPNTTVADIEVVDDASLYAAVNVGGVTGYVCPLIYSGLYWNASDYITVFGGARVASLTYIPEANNTDSGQVLAGSMVGDVAYTTTGGNTPGEWTVIPVKVGASGPVYADAVSLLGGPIFAVESTPGAPGPGGIAGLVWVYFIGSGAPAWFPCEASTLTAPVNSLDIMIYGGCIYFISQGNVAAVNTVQLARSFIADALIGGWARINFSVPVFGATAGNIPDVLKGSADASGLPGPQIWFIDTTVMPLYATPMKAYGQWQYNVQCNVVYTDELAVTVPVLTSPVDKYIVQVNKETGIAYNVALIWTPAAGAVTYWVQVALDSTFTNVVLQGAAVPPLNIGPWVAFITGWQLVYQPGEIYYWRVRAIGPFFSHWSGIRELDIQSAPIPVPVLYSPLNDAVVNTLNPSFSWSPMSGTMTDNTDPTSGITTTYTLQLGTDPNFSATTLVHAWQITNTTGFVIPMDATYLIDGNTYYWRVCPQITPLTNWSATFHFSVDLSLPTVTVTSTTTAVPSTIGVPSGSATHTDNVVNPSYIWAIIIIGALLVIAIIVLIFRTRRS
jgi:hypothetical protein